MDPKWNVISYAVDVGYIMHVCFSRRLKTRRCDVATGTVVNVTWICHCNYRYNITRSRSNRRSLHCSPVIGRLCLLLRVVPLASLARQCSVYGFRIVDRASSWRN